MPNKLDGLKRLMAEYVSTRDGDKPFGYNIFPYVRALMNAAPALIAAAEAAHRAEVDLRTRINPYMAENGLHPAELTQQILAAALARLEE